MKTPEFNKVVERRIELIKSSLTSKQKEYSKDNDKLHHFNIGSKITSKPREQVLWGMALKHLISVIDIIDNINELPSESLLEEKVGDMINYLILLEASVKDKITKENE